MPKRLFFLKLLVALGLGGLMTLGFAPFNWGYGVPVLLALFLLLLRGERGKRAFMLGSGFGFGFFAFGIAWVHISLHQFGGASLGLSMGMAMLLALYLALYYGVLAWIVGRSKLGLVMTYGFLFPVVGVLLELVRAHLFTGFPWLALGYSLTEMPFAPFLFSTMGALLSSFWVYFVAGILVLFVLQFAMKIVLARQIRLSGSDERKSDENAGRETLLRFPLLYGLLLAGIVGIAYEWVGEPIEPSGKTVRAGLLQGNIAQDAKFHDDFIYHTLDTYFDLIAKVSDRVDLIVMPETAIPIVYDGRDGVSAHFHRLAELSNADIISGIFTGDRLTERFRNGLVHYGKSDQTDHFYEKYRLLPFGEYIPFRGLLSHFNDWVEIPYSDLEAGQKEQAPFQFRSTEAKGSASICYEAVFGDMLRYQAVQSEFLINVSNDAWFGESIGPWQHLQIARARSIELARPMIRATNTGVTAIIDHQGKILGVLPQFETDALVGEFQPMTGLTAYAKLGDGMWILILLGVTGLMVLVTKRYARRLP